MNLRYSRLGALDLMGRSWDRNEALGEEAPVRARRLPAEPTPQERADHEGTHYPYRNRCRHCVASCGRRDGHPSNPGETDEGIAVIALDYAFFSDREEQPAGQPMLAQVDGDAAGSAPILVMRDKLTKAIFADVVHAKGNDEYAIKVTVEHILFLGHAVIKIRSDGENPIKALVNRVAELLKEKGVRVVPETTPVGDSQAGGLQESAVKMFKDKTDVLGLRLRASWVEAGGQTCGVAMVCAVRMSAHQSDIGGL